MAHDVFSKNGEILPATEAVMPISNIEYAYGFGVYETVRAVRNRPLFLDDHLRRLMRSAEILGLEHSFDVSTLGAWVHDLLAASPSEACNLKMLLIGARNPADATLFIIPLAPLFPDKRLYTKGAKAITREYERIHPHAKSLNMLGSYLAYRDAKAAGAYDALLINKHGCITEGTRTNFFCMQGTTLISPPKADVLEGVTMMHVLEAASRCGIGVEEREIPLASIGQYESVLLTSTSSKVMPLSSINEQTFAISEPLKTLMSAFDILMKESLEA